MNRPKIIVITPVRNEAWVLDAFLMATSAWADYIVLVDQHSTDGSREIAQDYEKVILIDNPDPEWHEMDARALSLEAAAKIHGDKIIFGIDADEFLSAGFENAKGWKMIMESTPNKVFCFRWLNLFDNYHTVEYNNRYMDWACHYDDSVDIVAEYKKREHHSVHASRIPCLETERTQYIMVDDIRFVHLAKLNKEKTRNKLDFYQVTCVDKNCEKYNPVSLYRSYAKYYPDNITHLKEDISMQCVDVSDTEVKSKIKSADYGEHYIDEMVAVFQREGITKFIQLNIWDNPRLIERGILPKKPLRVKLLHFYLNRTQGICDNILIKFVDKVLKRIC